MFFIISNRRFVQHTVFTLFVMFCISTALLFAGCAETGTGPDAGADVKGNLNGKWVNVYKSEGFPDIITTVIIDTSAKTIDYSDNYEGKIVNAPDYTATDGVLIIQFTTYMDWDDTFTLSTTHASVGKFGALYWTGLKSDMVFLADAYTGITHVMFDTLDEARTAFEPTADKVGSFVKWSIISPYTKE